MMFSELDADRFRCGNEFAYPMLEQITRGVQGVASIGIDLAKPGGDTTVFIRRPPRPGDDRTFGHRPPVPHDDRWFKPVNWELPYELRTEG